MTHVDAARDMGDRAARPLAVVTGASSGIGAATATALARAGWQVVMVARDAARLAAQAGTITAAGGVAWTYTLDAADGASVMAMADDVLRRAGVPRLIVNSAGAGAWKYLEDTPPAEGLAMLGAPFLAAYNVSHAFMPHLLRARRGVLVHVGSPAAYVAWPGATAYTASRWALRGLHEALCQDLAGTGVHSCHVVFGKVSSPYFAHNPGSEEHIPGVARLIPVMTPEASARVILGLAARPRPLTMCPGMLRVLQVASLLCPPLVRYLARRTGRRRQPLRSIPDVDTEPHAPPPPSPAAPLSAPLPLHGGEADREPDAMAPAETPYRH